VKTPAIDGLAAKGTRFTDFYSGCAVCSPSRATLLTGRHHIRAGVYSWIHDASQNSHLLPREVTLAEILKSQGYATAHIGKWHLGLPTATRDKPTPDRHGFDYWFATWNNASPSHHNPNNFIRNGEPVGSIEGYSCQIVVDEAIAWLDRREDTTGQPFFLNIWFHEPHAPIAAPQEIVDQYGDHPDDKAAVYSGTIDNTDRAIARLLKKLAEIDAPEDTLIIYASDNGSYRKDRVGGLRGQKGVNWEGGIRVPGIFHWPGTIEAGAVSSEPAGLVDVLPTICGLLNLEKPTGVHLDGSDLSPILTGKAGEFTRHQPLFWHLQRSRPIVAMRDGDYSLVADPDYQLSTDNMFQEAWIPAIKQGGYRNFQLFNLKTDPNQTTDIAADYPDRLQRMKKQMLEINASIMADGHDWHLQH
jgi:arylsulfatase A